LVTDFKPKIKFFCLCFAKQTSRSGFFFSELK